MHSPQKIRLLGILFFISMASCDIYTRSIFRPIDHSMPKIVVQYKSGGPKFEHIDSHYNRTIFEIFDKKYCFDHLLPSKAITYRYDTQKTVTGKRLTILLEKLVNEITNKICTFEDFIILKDSNFNYQLYAGFLVLKFKDYPFVVKLSIEYPWTFVQPLNKGFETQFFFYLSSTGRHTNIITRIKNLEVVKQELKKDPVYRHTVDLPRKWFWVPKNPPWLSIHGYNIGPTGSMHTYMPSICAVIADEIRIAKVLSISNKNDARTALAINQYLKNKIDAHIDNFVVDRETGKIVIIDTEHFPTVVGLEREIQGNDYSKWYHRLIQNMYERTFFRHKKARKEAQFKPPSPMAFIRLC